MIGPNYFVYIAGGVKRDDGKIRAFAEVMHLGLYDAKVMLGAPGPRKVGAHAREDEAEMQALQLRQAGLVAFVIDKSRFSRAPKIFTAVKAVENKEGLVFTIEPEVRELQADRERTMELPQPKGFVRVAVLGYYSQVTVRTDSRVRSRESSLGRSTSREPFLHLYSEDPHTILEIRGGKFEFPWPDAVGALVGDARWQKMADVFSFYYGAKLDTTLFRVPEEADTITAALNVAASGTASGAPAAASSNNSPVAMAASRIIAYSLVFGV